MNRSDAWFERQLAHARAAMAEADKQHTPEEIAAAEAALVRKPFRLTAPPHVGLIPGGQPEPSGLADRGFLGG